MYPVEVAYLSEPSSDYVESAVQAVFDIHAKVSPAEGCTSAFVHPSDAHDFGSLRLAGARGRYPRLFDRQGGD